MAAINKGKSSLDKLVEAGFVWGAGDGEAQIADTGAFDALGVMSLSVLARR